MTRKRSEVQILYRPLRHRRHLGIAQRSRRAALATCLITLLLVGLPAPAAVAVDGFGTSFEYPILLDSPRHATFSGTVDCDSPKSPVTVTLRFRLFQNTVAEAPATARTTVECVPFHVHLWSVEFEGGIFHPGTGWFHVTVTACDVVDCMSLSSTSNATIRRAREVSRPS